MELLLRQGNLLKVSKLVSGNPGGLIPESIYSSVSALCFFHVECPSLVSIYYYPRIIAPLNCFFQGHRRSMECFLNESSREVYLILGILPAA